MEMQFVVESAGGRASKCQLGRHQLVFDMPIASGGSAKGPGPLAVFGVSAAACMHYFASGVLTRRDLPTDGLKVTITANKGEGRLDAIGLTIEVPDADEELLAAVREAALSCPVHGTLSNPPQVDVEVLGS